MLKTTETLMDTAYKIYVNIMNERLKREGERKLEEEQFEFRKERDTIDAIYTLNYVVNRKITKKRGKVFAFFIDLKVTFDKVDRKKLAEMLKKVGTKEKLRRRIMETYKETRNIIKIGNRKTEEFWTKSSVRQGCPMNLTLFNIYNIDLEEELRRSKRKV